MNLRNFSQNFTSIVHLSFLTEDAYKGWALYVHKNMVSLVKILLKHRGDHYNFSVQITSIAAVQSGQIVVE